MICENGVPYIYDVELEWGYRAGRYGHAEYKALPHPCVKRSFFFHHNVPFTYPKGVVDPDPVSYTHLDVYKRQDS